MDALIHSFLLVAVAEFGDKTQLLSILLAARYRVFTPIIAGIFIATIINHGLAAIAGELLAGAVDMHMVNIIASILFILIGLWVLIPDKAPECDTPMKYGAFVTSLITFFLAEMGDKTQLVTVTLAAEYQNILMVLIGTTAGMMLTNTPAVFCGEKILQLVPLKTVRIIASLMFVGFGIYNLL